MKVDGLINKFNLEHQRKALKNINLKFSSWSFAIRVNTRPFLVYYYFYDVFLSYQAQCYFVVSFTLKVILHVAENDTKYRDMAPLRL